MEVCRVMDVLYLVSVALRDSRLLGPRPRRCQHLLQLVLLEQVGNFTRVQHVVDVLQELLHYDLGNVTKASLSTRHLSVNSSARVTLFR